MTVSVPELTETQIQKQILDYLATIRIFAWRNNTRSVRVGGRLMHFGHRGSPDILGVLPGGTLLAIEVKKPGEEPSDPQKEFLSRLSAAGARVIIADCLEDVISQVSWDRLRRDRV